MVAIPLHIYISVGGISINCGVQAAIRLRDNQNVQKGHGAIFPAVISCELYTLVYRVDMLIKAASVCLFDDYKSVTYI